MKMVVEKSDLLKLFEERFDSFESGLNGAVASRFHEKRKKAFSQLSNLGFPGRKNEEYKYTPITKVLERGLEDKNPIDQPRQPDLIQLLSGEKDLQILVFKNGRFDLDNSSFIQEKGAKLMSLSEASAKNDEVFLKYFNNALPDDADSFSLLNTSFSKEGVFLHVSKNSVIEKAFLILHLNTAGENSNITHPRNLIVLEEGSEATFIECFQTSGQFSVFSNSLSEFIVRQNANANYMRFGFDTESSIRVSTANVYQESDSRFSSLGIDFGGKTIRNNLNVVVDGTGCESHMNGLYLLNGSSHVDNHTMIDHKQPNCISNELYKGILAEKAHGVFNGKIYVRKDAQKTNAFQQNNNILLSNEAIINTKPQLEIWADDVKCSHGCTSGQIDEEQIFYLRTRGIDELSARKMLLNAYAGEILESINHKTLKEFSENRISNMLAEI